MAGGTHAFDMIKRLKENENLRKRRNYFKAKERYQIIEKHLLIDYKTASHEQRQLLRREVIRRQRQERTSVIITFLTLATVALAITVAVLKFLQP
jgi:hypothetical protein